MNAAMVAMGWQEVPPAEKRDDLDGHNGGKHYVPGNFGQPCFESARRLIRNRLICPACGSKWGLPR